MTDIDSFFKISYVFKEKINSCHCNLRLFASKKVPQQYLKQNTCHHSCLNHYFSTCGMFLFIILFYNYRHYIPFGRSVDDEAKVFFADPFLFCTL